MLPDYAIALNQVRLEHDWTWIQLGEAMRRAKVYVSARTLSDIQHRAGRRNHERTIFKIQKFLVLQGGRKPAKARRRAPSVTPATEANA